MRKVEANLARILLAVSLTCLNAYSQKKATPAPAHPATAAPASGAAAHPAGSATPAAKGPTTSGPTTSGSTTKGPTTSGPTTKGPTTSSPATKGPTTAEPARPTTTATRPPVTPHPPIAHTTPSGSTERHVGDKDIRSRQDGKISDVHDARRGLDVHHGLNGDRRVSVERADHSRIVADRGGRGYVQRPYMFHGHEFAHRTYYAHGRAYDRFYRRYPYRGVYLEVYAPRVYYQPAFYGYVYAPWVAPVPYAWGFAGTPWFGFYGGYFAPAPMYATPSLWLTDYMVSNALQQGYQARVDAGLPMQPGSDPTPLSPDVKAQIADEVKRQIALENAEATGNAQHQEPDPQSSGIARMLADGAPLVFVVGENMDLVDTTGKECMVSPGDVLQLLPTAPNATNANLTVRASKGGQECAKATNVLVTLNDLQSMQNFMRETIDQGLGDMQNGRAKGLPPEPASVAKNLVATADFAVGAPPPEPNSANEIAQQAREGDASEVEAGKAQSSGPGPSDPTNGNTGAAPKEISLGMTVDQVTALYGPPKTSANVGVKKILAYPDLKVTFTNGKVSDIQ